MATGDLVSSLAVALDPRVDVKLLFGEMAAKEMTFEAEEEAEGRQGLQDDEIDAFTSKHRDC